MNLRGGVDDLRSVLVLMRKVSELGSASLTLMSAIEFFNSLNLEASSVVFTSIHIISNEGNLARGMKSTKTFATGTILSVRAANECATPVRLS